jgi:hypothetical protein
VGGWFSLTWLSKVNMEKLGKVNTACLSKVRIAKLGKVCMTWLSKFSTRVCVGAWVRGWADEKVVAFSKVLYIY